VDAGVEQHLHPLWIEPYDEVFAVGDDGDSDASREVAPFPQLVDVFRYVRFFVFTAVFI